MGCSNSKLEREYKFEKKSFSFSKGLAEHTFAGHVNPCNQATFNLRVEFLERNILENSFCIV